MDYVDSVILMMIIINIQVYKKRLSDAIIVMIMLLIFMDITMILMIIMTKAIFMMMMTMIKIDLHDFVFSTMRLSKLRRGNLEQKILKSLTFFTLKV